MSILSDGFVSATDYNGDQIKIDPSHSCSLAFSVQNEGDPEWTQGVAYVTRDEVQRLVKELNAWLQEATS